MNAVYEMKNYPVVLISTVISPLSLLAVVTFVSKGALFGTAIEGGLIMTFFSSGIAHPIDLSHLKNDFKLQDMVVSSPTSSRLYMGGNGSCGNCLLNSIFSYLIALAGNLFASFASSNSNLIHCTAAYVRYFSGFRVSCYPLSQTMLFKAMLSPGFFHYCLPLCRQYITR